MHIATNYNELLSPQDVATLAGDVGAPAVRYWEKTGKLQSTRTASGNRLFRRDDVERFLDMRTRARRDAGRP